MNAVMYGAGNIGRGFVGALMAQSGYSVTFVDVSREVVDRLNEARKYPLRIVSGDGYEEMEITRVCAVHGSDRRAVAEAIAHAELVATAVGAKALPFIAANIAAGLRLRWEMSDAPLDILICENLMDADKALRKLLKENLDPSEHPILDRRVGLVETSIGRMVPVQTPELQDGDPMRVCVERYGFLPVDRDAFKGKLPPLQNLVPFSPFDFYLKRKLFLHNMSHAVCAYLGLYTGREYIHEAALEPHIRLIVKEAMTESATALAEEYAVPMRDILLHCDDLLIRFGNQALKDTCARVGGDPERKLHPSDRLIGAALLCEKHGVSTVGIAIGAAGAIYQYLNERGRLQKDTSAEAALREIAGIEPKSPLGSVILEFYGLYRRGTNPGQLYQAAEAIKKASMPDITG